MKKLRAYLDAGIFISFINGYEESSEACKSILEAATRGDIEIVTSCITLPEVTKKRSTALVKPANDEATITAIFQNPAIIYVSVDPRVGTLAQQVIWDFGKQFRDSVHVASAIAANADVLYTVDGGLLDLSEKIDAATACPKDCSTRIHRATRTPIRREYPGISLRQSNFALNRAQGEPDSR